MNDLLTKLVSMASRTGVADEDLARLRARIRTYSATYPDHPPEGLEFLGEAWVLAERDKALRSLGGHVALEEGMVEFRHDAAEGVFVCTLTVLVPDPTPARSR